MTGHAKSKRAEDAEVEALRRERAAFVDVVGTEISAIWRNVTRLGGQCVAALYLWNEPRSMDDLAEELGRSKSNVFANLRALESLGIVRRARVSGSARDHYELAGEYPDILVVAFSRHLSHTLSDKSRELLDIARRIDDEAGAAGKDLSGRVAKMGQTYGAAGALIDALLPGPDEKKDLVSIVKRVTPALLKGLVGRLRQLG